jgi:hypothetical protein
MNIKIRLQIQYEGKKFILPLPDINTKVGELKMIIADKLGLKDKVSQLTLFTANEFSLDMDLDEFASQILDDKDIVIVRLGAQQNPTPVAPKDSPIIPPHVFPVLAKSHPSPASNAEPMRVEPPKEEAKGMAMPVLGLNGRGFKYRFLKKDQGFLPVSEFDSPLPNEKLNVFSDRLLASLNIPTSTYAAFLYHPTGAPISVNLSQQDLIFCHEVIDKEATHYVIVVPKIIETPIPNAVMDPHVGATKITVEFLGRKFEVNVDYAKTTFMHLKQKLSQLLKVSLSIELTINIRHLLSDSGFSLNQMKCSIRTF